MQRNLLPVFLAVFSGTLLLASDLWAQNRGGNSGSAPTLFGSRTMGTPGGASRSIPSGGGGLGGLGGGQGLGNMLQGSLLTGNERFLRGNQGGFIGADAADVNAINNAMSGAAGRMNNRSQNVQGRNATGRNGRGTNQAGRRGQNTGRGGQQMLQPQLHVAFHHPELVPATVSANLTARIRKDLSSRLENVAGVEVEGRLVTLRGTVASRYDRMVVEKLVMLEPGVSRVQNELRVVPPQPAADQPAEPRP